VNSAEAAVGHYGDHVSVTKVGREPSDDGVGVGKRLRGFAGSGDVRDKSFLVHHVAVGFRIFEIEYPGDYHLGKGFAGGDWSSFPSGHTSTAFAAAAAVTNETTRWWPRSVWIVGPMMYGGATAVGLSRMYHNRHWGSDVLLGAAIGTFSGRKMVQYAHGHPDNRLDRIMLSTTIVPDGRGGVSIGTSIPFP